MKYLTSVVLIVGILGQSYGDDHKCSESECVIENNCRCSTAQNPLDPSDSPQLVVLAFVEAVTAELYDNRWSELLESRKNPDDSYIGATFYVPHEYTDYQRVQDLALAGFEVGVRSISNEPHQIYWRDATQTLIEQEFGGQKKIISKFANIPEEYITGVMTPQFQLAGDNSINGFVSQGFTYDSSWTSRAAMFPYTFDYISSQVCDTGNNCPSQPHAGFWEAPIIDLVAEDDVCATVAACFRKRNNQTKQEVSDWLYQQVENQRTAKKAPVTFIIESTWFDNVETAWDGLVDGLNRLENLPDVFFVTQSRVIQWIKDPQPLSSFTTDLVDFSSGCSPYSCTLAKPDGTIRYMNSCVPCPKTYPWLGNPEGN